MITPHLAQCNNGCEETEGSDVATITNGKPGHSREIERSELLDENVSGDTTEIRSILGSLDQLAWSSSSRLGAREQARLRDQMRRAGELGIFGAPSFVAGGELLWGNDCLEDALA